MGKVFGLDVRLRMISQYWILFGNSIRLGCLFHTTCLLNQQYLSTALEIFLTPRILVLQSTTLFIAYDHNDRDNHNFMSFTYKTNKVN